MADTVQGSIVRVYGTHLGMRPEHVPPPVAITTVSLDPPAPPAAPDGLRIARAPHAALGPVLVAALGQPNLERRTAMKALMLGIILAALAAAPAQAIEFTVSASVVTATYTEPALNADGSALVDLDHTSVYYRIGTAEPVKGPAVPASAPAGGGAITTQVNVPVAAGQEADVDFWATATDASGNESVPSATVRVRIDRLAPAPPQ